KLPEEAQVEVHDTGTAQQIAAARAEARLIDGSKCPRIEERRARAHGSRPLHGGLDLVCRLRVSRRVELSAGSSHGERRSTVKSADAVHLPVAEHQFRNAVVGEALATAERQFINPAQLEDVSAVISGQGAVT